MGSLVENSDFINFLENGNIWYENLLTLQNIKSISEVNIFKSDDAALTNSWVIIELPFKINSKFWLRQQVFVPIIDVGIVENVDEINIDNTDTIFNTLEINYINQTISEWNNYLEYGIDYSTFPDDADINNLDVQLENLKYIYLNKFYIIQYQIEENINFLLR